MVLKEGEREKHHCEREIWIIVSSICPNQASNLQPRLRALTGNQSLKLLVCGIVLQSTKPLGQSNIMSAFKNQLRERTKMAAWVDTLRVLAQPELTENRTARGPTPRK